MNTNKNKNSTTKIVAYGLLCIAIYRIGQLVGSVKCLKNLDTCDGDYASSNVFKNFSITVKRNKTADADEE